MHKAYIVIFTCATLRSIILDLVEDNNCKNFKNSIKKFIARRGCPKKIISDNGKVFKAQESQMFCSEGGITWKFNLDGALWWEGFWEILVGMVKKSLKKSIRSKRLPFTELSTVFFEIENVLNNRPLCFICDVSEVLTPNSLLYDRKLDFENKCIVEGHFEVAKENELWLRKCVLQKVVESFWLMWHQENLDGLREIRSCRKVGKGASEIRVGNVVVIEEVLPRHRWRLGVVVELLEDTDGYVRGAKVKVGKTKNIIQCPVD